VPIQEQGGKIKTKYNGNWDNTYLSDAWSMLWWHNAVNCKHITRKYVAQRCTNCGRMAACGL